MIEFMVISAPRSGSTWVSNWLNTDKTLCLHDLLSTVHYREWDSVESKKKLGVADTGVAVFHEFLNEHPARKLIIHRPLEEVNASLEEIGYPKLTSHWDGALDRIRGVHVDWRAVFTNPKSIYEYLLQEPFDEERHAELVKIEMQPQWAGLKINKEVTRNIIREVMELNA